VIDALRQGKKIDAIKAYRVATGAGLREAREYVEELQRRATPRV
jgi:ribosomal protein L7/L12